MREQEVRCRRCSVLLLQRDGDRITLRRSGLQAALTGRDFQLAVTCYRCGTLHMVVVSKPPSKNGAPSAL